jgi:hypothetical protein
MWHLLHTAYRNRLGIALTLALISLAQPSVAGQRAGLSPWLDSEALPELRKLFTRHPRFAGQRLQLVAEENTALSQAIIASLVKALGSGAAPVTLVTSRERGQHRTVSGSVDELACNADTVVDYVLEVSALHDAAGADRVGLRVVSAGQSGDTVRYLLWSGRFTAAEARAAGRPGAQREEDGSLQAPWSEQSVEAAARSLSRDFACALRPWISSRLNLQWPADAELPALFSDTANTSRHLLGAYREIGFMPADAHYLVAFRLERVRADTWQLWLIGTPRSDKFAPVQAVTYFRGNPARPPAGERANLAHEERGSLVTARRGQALDYIDVEVLDATQADLGGARAQLQVTLRIGNRSQWAIAYAFSLSGGHFNHCIATPAYYRHDAYGRLAGSVPGGSTIVRRIVIEDAQHHPAPWFGIRKCAGFRDLDGFEDYVALGHKVTEFVHWDL